MPWQSRCCCRSVIRCFISFNVIVMPFWTFCDRIVFAFILRWWKNEPPFSENWLRACTSHRTTDTLFQGLHPDGRLYGLSQQAVHHHLAPSIMPMAQTDSRNEMRCQCWYKPYFLLFNYDLSCFRSQRWVGQPTGADSRPYYGRAFTIRRNDRFSFTGGHSWRRCALCLWCIFTRTRNCQYGQRPRHGLPIISTSVRTVRCEIPCTAKFHTGRCSTHLTWIFLEKSWNICVTIRLTSVSWIVLELWNWCWYIDTSC